MAYINGKEVLFAPAKSESGGGGIDISDATAAAADVVANKTFYANGGKQTGTMPALKSLGESALYLKKNTNPTAPTGYLDLYFRSQNKAYVPETIPAGDEAGIGGVVAHVIEENLVPANIKKDVSLFGGTLVGEYEGESGATVEEWQAGRVYNPNDIAIDNGIYYICIKTTQADAVLSNPENTPDEWERLNGSYKGEYNEAESYGAGDIVEKNGAIYQANRDNPQTPPDNDMGGHWTKLYEGSGSGGDSLEKVFSGELLEVNLPNITKLKNYAFYHNTDTTKVSIPKVTEIGERAFEACGLLETIELSSGLKSIGIYGFASCKKLALTELPEGLTSIGNYAFQLCSNLALTKLPEGLSVGTHCFTGCKKLALTKLPSSWTTITQNLFQNCEAMVLTELPNGITQIDSYAFHNCYKLALTELPSGLTKIGNNAFQYCSGLTSLTFKSTPTSIGSSAFSGCSNLLTLNLPWAEGAVSGAPWGATKAEIIYNYTGG